MDYADSVAGWIGALATAIGLSSLIAQGTIIQERIDPFYPLRDMSALGLWATRQQHRGWYQLKKPKLVGPLLFASWRRGFCGVKEIYLNRQPLVPIGNMSWTAVMAVFSPESSNPDARNSGQGNSKEHAWSKLGVQELVRHRDTAGVHITRTTLITLLCVSNARQIFKFSSSSGYRASFGSYSGLWTIEWPIGSSAVVRLSLHDLFTETAKDMYPPSLKIRVDRCIEMLAGIVDNQAGSRTAFPGRKSVPGLLEFHRRGFAGSHGSRHFFNIAGGNVFEVDLLHWRNIESVEIAELGDTIHTVLLPSSNNGETVQLFIGPNEHDIIINSLDSLPWAHISWSMHRGLRDILLAVGKPTMNQYRTRLAVHLQNTTMNSHRDFIAKGWNPEFVAKSMPDIIYSVVMAGKGDSGDVVRALTDASLVAVGRAGMGIPNLDQTTFWKSAMNQSKAEGTGNGPSGDLSDSELVSLLPDEVIALTKFIVLEWSQEMDYQMYHDLPINLLLI